MNLEKKTQEKIAIEVIRVLVRRFELFPIQNRALEMLLFMRLFWWLLLIESVKAT